MSASDEGLFGPADEEIHAGRYLEAVGLLSDIAGGTVSSEVRSGAFRRMGDILALYIGNSEQSQKAHLAAIQVAPVSAEANLSRFSLGMLAFESGNCSTAKKYFSEFLAVTGDGEKAANARFMLEHCKPLGQENKQPSRAALTSSPVSIRVRITGSGRYRGRITATPDGARINVVDLEEYLYGVVPREVSPKWPGEALKAQAVVARTFALYQALKRRDQLYDVDASTASQVYGGIAAESPATTAAVNTTDGEVLTFAGAPILAYFHSHSGGRTERSGEVWSVDLPYFPVKEDPYSAKAKDTNWSARLSVPEILRGLATQGVALAGLETFRPTQKSPSGRLSRVEVGSTASRRSISGNTLRLALGPERVKSTLMQVKVIPGGFEFVGVGYGHGVGLSQWGAYQMAKEGFDYRQILAYYYQNVEITKLW